MSVLFAAVSLAALQAHSQSTGSGNTGREMQRGVPGTDVDVNTNADGRPRSNGVPGVDVDVNNRTAAGNRGGDTRAMGAAGSAGAGTDAMGQRAARADRN